VFVDPAVCRAKFDREVSNLRTVADAYHRRGIWLIEAAFPEVFLVLIGINVQPNVVAFGVIVNFENYDVQPLSIRFVNPLTRSPLKLAEIAPYFPAFVAAVGPNAQPGQLAVQGLIQGFTQDHPFLCLQGVREYHENPAHSGDSWLLYRKTGAGTLAQLLEIMVKHSTDCITSFNMDLRVTSQNVGLFLSPQPL
jgi:hypothetical protein